MYSTEGLSEELAVVTPDQAGAYLDSCDYERQRPLAQTHVAFLVNEILAGRFRRGTQIHFGVLDGKPYILNGRHTLASVRDSGVPMPLSLLFENVQNEAQLGRLYARHDIHRARDWSAALRATGQFEKFNLAKVWVSTALYAVPYVVNDLKPTNTGNSKSKINSRSRDERLDALEKVRDEVAIIAQACEGASTENLRMIRRRPVFAAAIVCATHQPKALVEFLGTTARDDGLRVNSPQKRFLEWMRKTPMVQQTFHDHLRAFECCWNAHFERETVERMRFNAGTLRLLGTHIGAVSRMPEKGKPAVAVPKLLKTGIAVERDGTQRKVAMVN